MWKQDGTKEKKYKNTALYAAYTVDTVDMVYTVDTAYTVYTIETALHYTPKILACMSIYIVREG